MAKANNFRPNSPKKNHHKITLAKLGWDPRMARLMNRRKRDGSRNR